MKKKARSRTIAGARESHHKFLKKFGVTPEQIKTKKKELGVKFEYNLRDPERTSPTSDKIPANGTKRDERYKLTVSSQYPIAPAFNKGAYCVIGKEDIKTAGRKI